MTENMLAVAPLPQCPPGGPVAADVSTAIGAWARSEAMSALVRAFGGKPPEGSVAEVLSDLDDFSDAWNYRKGGLERHQVAPLTYESHIDELIQAASTALGLGGQDRLTYDTYDHVLVLGGGPRTAIARPRFAAELLRGGLRAGEVSVLTGMRELAETERALSVRLGLPEVATEADLMAAGLEREFGLTGPAERRDGVAPNGSPWWVSIYRLNGLTAHVVAAPPSNPAWRTTTGDGYDGWASYVRTPSPTDRVLVVSSDIYLPFQHADAIRLLGLPYRCGVDSVGPRSEDYPGVLIVPPNTGRLLEIRSAIKSFRKLHQAL
jgi:hypothetical protein